MVVARAQVHVAAQLATLAAHHQQHLGVGLVADHAVDHLHARFLQAVGEAEVGLLVEARAQLDHHGDVLAVARSLHQVLDDRRVLAGPVKGLLDRQHARVVGGLADELEHRRERVERVVQQHVAGGHALEDRVDIGQLARHERRVLQVRAVDLVVDLDDAVEVDRAVDAIHRVGRQLEVRSEEHTSELQSLMRISYAVFCLKKKKTKHNSTNYTLAKTNQYERTRNII